MTKDFNSIRTMGISRCKPIVFASFCLSSLPIIPHQAHSLDRCDPPKEVLQKFMTDVYRLLPNESKPLPGCPGADDFEPGIANFKIHDVTFRIPRSLLMLGPGQADGPTQSFRVRLDGQTLGDNLLDSTFRTSAYVERLHSKFATPPNDKMELREALWRLAITLDNPNFFKYKEKHNIEAKFDQNLELWSIDTRKNRKIFFTNYDYKYPEYWFDCNIKYRCEGYIYLKRRIFIRFGFYGYEKLKNYDTTIHFVMGELQNFSDRNLSIEQYKTPE